MNSSTRFAVVCLGALLGMYPVLRTIPAAAQEEAPSPPALDQIEHFVGTWKTTIQEDGEEQTQYLIFRQRPELNALAQWTFNVDSESRQLQEATFGFLGMPNRTGQIQGLVFRSDGLVAETMGTLKDQELYVKGFGTMANGARVSADIHYRLDADGRLVQNWTDLMTPWGHLTEGMKREFTKIDAGMRDLFREQHIIAPENVELDPSLAPLSHLVGRWQARDADGNVQHDQIWQPRVMGRWLAERWRMGNGNSGINVTGIDPATGRLTLWVITRGVIGRFGHWDILSDNTVGQVQGQNRLTREFVKTDTEEMFVCRWQRPEDGRFVNTDSRYVVKRFSPAQENEAQQDREVATAEPVDYGQPKVIARIEYMQVPEGGEELYFKVEDVWKKIHRARREAGVITNWMLLKVDRTPQTQGDYNYVVVHLSESFDKLRNDQMADLNLEFTSEEQEIYNQTGTARELVRSDYWDLVASAEPDRFGQPGFDPTTFINRMQSKNEARHWELEQSVWRRIWSQHVTDGHLWNWHLWRRRTGDGFNFVAVLLRPEGQTAALPVVVSEEIREKALPDMSREAFADAVRETGEVRDMVGSERWILLESLDHDQ